MKWPRNDLRPQHPLSPPHIRADQSSLARLRGRGGDERRGGGRTQPNSRSDESPWVLGARGIPLLYLSPFSSSLPLFLPIRPTPTSLLPFKSFSSSVSSLAPSTISLFPGFLFHSETSPPLLAPDIPPLPIAATAVATTPSITNTTQWGSSPSTSTKPPTSTISGGDR